MGKIPSGNGAVDNTHHHVSAPRPDRMPMRSLPTPHLLIQNGHTVSRDGLWPSPFHADFPYSFVQNNAARAATPPLQATPNRLPRNLPGLREARRSYTAGQSAKDIGMSYLGNPRKYDLVPKGHFVGSEQDASQNSLSAVPPGSPFPKRRGDAHFFRSASAAPRLVQLPANLPNYFFRTQSPAVLQSFQGSRRDAVWSSQPEMF